MVFPFCRKSSWLIWFYQRKTLGLHREEFDLDQIVAHFFRKLWKWPIKSIKCSELKLSGWDLRISSFWLQMVWKFSKYFFLLTIMEKRVQYLTISRKCRYNGLPSKFVYEKCWFLSFRLKAGMTVYITLIQVRTGTRKATQHKVSYIRSFFQQICTIFFAAAGTAGLCLYCYPFNAVVL